VKRGEAPDAHTNSCELCRETAALLRDMEGYTPPATPAAPGRDSDCPDADDLAAVAAGTESAEKSTPVLEHVAGCSRCAGEFKKFQEIFTPETVCDTVLKSSSAAWQRKLARTIARQQAPSSVRRKYSWAYAVAGLCATAVVAVFVIQRNGADTAELLLAKAYTEQRPFDIRLPDAGHAPVRQRMSASSSFNRSVHLIQAEAEIANRLTHETPELLTLKGRAEMLTGQFEAAIASLEKARDMDGSPSVLLHLACAYALRGDAADYPRALDLIDRYLQSHPRDAEALFNRAVILERMQLFEESAAAWDRYFQVDPAGPWAEEARERRTAAVQKKRFAQMP
jgi:tetratricopeptide (TPR) repeat protein